MHSIVGRIVRIEQESDASTKRHGMRRREENKGLRGSSANNPSNVTLLCAQPQLLWCNDKADDFQADCGNRSACIPYYSLSVSLRNELVVLLLLSS